MFRFLEGLSDVTQAAIFSGLLSSFLTGLIALFSVYLNNRAQNARAAAQLDFDRKKHEREILLGKFENLFKATRTWLDSISDMQANYLMHIGKQMTYEQLMEKEQSTAKKRVENLLQTEMLIRMYFPEVSPDLQLVQKLHEPFFNLVKVVHNSPQGNYKFSDDELAAYTNSRLALLKAENQLLEKIAKLGNERASNFA